MKKHILFPLTAVALTLSTHTMASSESSIDMPNEARSEAIGLGTGVLAGAAIGGPIGAMVGGVVGLLIAEDVNNDKKLAYNSWELNENKQQLAAQSKALAWKDNEIAQLKDQYEASVQSNAVQLVAMEKEIEKVVQEMESNVLFRTASYAVEEHFKSQLDLVARGLKSNPQLVVTLSGFADRRGDDAYNQQLSKQRAWSVREYLVSQGVKDNQINTSSFGESKPVDSTATIEGHFFDRRVLVRVSQAEPEMTAANN